jgi:hypothetical protein
MSKEKRKAAAVADSPKGFKKQKLPNRGTKFENGIQKPSVVHKEPKTTNGANGANDEDESFDGFTSEEDEQAESKPVAQSNCMFLAP